MPASEKAPIKAVSILEKIKEPFSIKSIKFKPQATSKDKNSALMVAFIDARDVEDRLDNIFGPAGWQFSVAQLQGSKVASVIGTLMIKFGEAWISKSDVGEASQDESSYKAAVSDALKRCAVQFGIFRYAYDLKFGWAKAVGGTDYKKEYERPVVPYHSLSDSDKICEDCGADIPPEVESRDGSMRDAGELICQTYYKRGRILCKNCVGK